MKKDNVKYLTFPVELLQKAFTDVKGVCSKAIDYGIYLVSRGYAHETNELEAMQQALDFLGITSTDVKLLHKHGKILYDSFNSPPLVSVNKDISFDYYKNDKTEFDVAVFCAFCGLRSILGRNAYSKSNRSFMIARMFGYRSQKEFEALPQKPPYYVSKFSTKNLQDYHLTERIIRNELEIGWGLKYYASNIRGFYFSFKCDIGQLAIYAKSSSKKEVIVNHSKHKKAAIADALKEFEAAKNRRTPTINNPPNNPPNNPHDTDEIRF